MCYLNHNNLKVLQLGLFNIATAVFSFYCRVTVNLRGREEVEISIDGGAILIMDASG